VTASTFYRKYASIDAMANAAGTISYELLTRLGRVSTVYANGATT
jgi:alanine racemase